jgi:peroxiredoxin
MASLSGDYDVIAEVGMELVNTILAAVHENQDTHYPTMPHGMALWIDDSYGGPADPIPESERTGVRARVEVQVSTPTVTLLSEGPFAYARVGPSEPVGDQPDSTSSPPSPATARFGHAGPEIEFGEVLEFGSISPGFAPPAVATTVCIRAWVRDPTDPPLPEFIDGELVVSAGLVRSDIVGAGTYLTVDRTAGPAVAFTAAPGTVITDSQGETVSALVRNFIRGEMDPPTFRVALPPEVGRFDYRLLAGAPNPSVLLMFTMAGRPVPPGAVASAAGGLIPDASHFAIGIGRDYLVGVLGSELFQDMPPSFHYSKYGVSATVRPDWGAASFDLVPGQIVFSLAGDGDISWWGIDDHFTFTVRQAFSLQVVDDGLQPVADGDPEVDLQDVAVGTSYLEGKARDTIKAERDAALAGGASQIQDALDVGRVVRQILAGIHPNPGGVTLTGVDIRPDGVVIPGTIALAPSAPIVVAEVPRGGFDDALESWIPGGTIDRLAWERIPSHPAAVRTEDHRFVTEPMGAGWIGSLCLTVEGTRVVAGGGRMPVSQRECFRFGPIIGPVEGLSMAMDADRPLVPLTEPVAGGGLRVVGHYDPWALGHLPTKGHANLVVHFAGETSVRGVALLDRALDRAGRRTSVVAVVVVSARALATLRASELSPTVLVTDDPGGDWARAFGVSRAPATVLVGPTGRVLWRDDSGINEQDLIRALADHAGPEREVSVHPVRLSLRVGDRAPDFPVRLPDGRELSLRRFSGRRVVLTFFTPRSQPSVDHLAQMTSAASPDRRIGPLVIAVADGSSWSRVEELVREKGSSVVILPDPERQISSMFGVWCWPATVRIDANGRVEGIDVGAANVAPEPGQGTSGAEGS